MAKSAVFRSEPRSYMRSLAFAWLAKRWAWFVIPLLAVIIWSFYDLRAVYVGLMLVFILFPMAMSFVWFNYAFSPQSRMAISPKTVECSEDGLSVEYLPIAEGVEPLQPQSIKWNKVKSVERGSGRIVLHLGDRLDDRLEIPVNAFEVEAWAEINRFLPENDDDILS